MVQADVGPGVVEGHRRQHLRLDGLRLRDRSGCLQIQLSTDDHRRCNGQGAAAIRHDRIAGGIQSIDGERGTGGGQVHRPRAAAGTDGAVAVVAVGKADAAGGRGAHLGRANNGVRLADSRA